jgi:hypothetical protein
VLVTSLVAAMRMRKILPEPPEVTEGVVTITWLRKFGVDPCIFDAELAGTSEDETKKLHTTAEELAKELLKKLRDNGVYYVHQVESLSMHQQLNDVLGCVGVCHTLTEAFDRKAAQLRRKKPIRNFLRSLAGNLSAMESMCVNYGLSAALVLTMTFANYGSVTNDDWRAYLTRIELTNPRCQALAESMCSAAPPGVLESVSSENTLAYWYPIYCQKAVLDLVDNPALNISAPSIEFPIGRGCCLNAIKCAIDASWNMELAFTLGCGGGTAMLLLVVLYTSWLYITINATKVNKGRWSEAKLLTKGLSGHFLVLQIFFIAGIFLAYVGVFSVVGMKSTTFGLSYVCVLVVAASGITATLLAFKILRDVYTMNACIDEARKSNRAWYEKTITAKRNDDRASSGTSDVVTAH